MMTDSTNTAAESRIFRPTGFQTLGRTQIDILHDAGLDIMERIGMRFFDREALDLFQKTGAKITDGNRVHIPPYLVERALGTAPKTSIFLTATNGRL